MTDTVSFYSQPSYSQRGGGYPVFSGPRRMRGGSILGALKSMIMPTLSRIGKTAGRRGLREAVGLATDVVGDTLQGRNITQSIMARGKNRALGFAKGLLGSVLPPQNTKRQPSRKRKAVRNNKHPAKKRRRVAKSLF